MFDPRKRYPALRKLFFDTSEPEMESTVQFQLVSSSGPTGEHHQNGTKETGTTPEKFVFDRRKRYPTLRKLFFHTSEPDVDSTVQFEVVSSSGPTGEHHENGTPEMKETRTTQGKFVFDRRKRYPALRKLFFDTSEREMESTVQFQLVSSSGPTGEHQNGTKETGTPPEKCVYR